MSESQTKWIYLTLLSLIWGSSFILIKKGLIGLDPYQLGSLRIVFAAIFLLAIGFRKLALIPQGKWKYIALTSLFGTFLPAFLFAIAETKMDSSISAILNSLTPLNTLLFGFFLFALNFRRNQVLGVCIGLAGSLILVFSGAASHPAQNYNYAVLVLIATLCYALNVNLVKKYLSELDSISITVGNFAVQIVPALVILFCSGFFSQLHQVRLPESVFYILILGVLGTGVANILFFKLIRISSPVLATSVTYLIPIVACFWGILDGESLAPLQILGMLVILAGVYLSSRK
jgi:drug/metabolite transporter (DMT)-like permease